MLRNLFFESLVLLLVVEAVAVAVALAVHRRRGTPGSRRGLWLTIAACVALVLVQNLVETDREQIEATVAAMARAVDDGDIPALGAHIDQSFEDRQLDRRAWLEDVRQRLQRWRIDDAKVGGFVTRVNGDTAEVAFRARCDWRGSNQQSPQTVGSTWKLGFIRRDDGWKLRQILSAQFGPGGRFDYSTILQY